MRSLQPTDDAETAETEALMPGLGRIPPDVRTVHLGEFTPEHAERIVALLEERGIAWWYKAPGYLSRIWEHGVHVFVDRAKLEEARGIAAEVLASPGSPRPPAGPARDA